jgi:hypothetical protein
MIESCSRAFELLWRIETDQQCVRARRFSVGAFQKFGIGDQASYERRFEQVIGNSPVLEAVFKSRRQFHPSSR